MGGTFWLGSARVCRRKVERSKISEYEAILGKGLGLEEVVFGEGSGLGEGSGPPQASCAADGLQTPTGGASKFPNLLPTDSAAQNPGSQYESTSPEFPSSVKNT